MINNIMASSKKMIVHITRNITGIEIVDRYINVIYVERDIEGLFIYYKLMDGSLSKVKYSNYELKTIVTSIKLIKPEDKEAHNENN